MGKLCDFCGEQRSMVYCRSDSACLCLSCDRNVHSANSLSKRHLRTLVCERCHSQPAVVRCIEENISLCQNCNWSGNTAPDSATVDRQTINCYSECPSAADFSRIWSFFSVDQASCNGEAAPVMIPEERDDNLSDCQMMPIDSCTKDADMDSIASDAEQVHGNESLNPKASPETKQDESLHDSFYQDFDVSDIELGMENCEEHFDEFLDDAQQYFENGGMDSLFEAGSSRRAEYVHKAKASSSKSEIMRPACSNQLSADSTTSCKSDQNVCISRSGKSTLPLTIDDDTDYEGFSMVVMEDYPHNIPSSESQLFTANRDGAVLRYKEKKKARKFDKKIRYASRKARADVRKRVKGRFVKAGERYDYDPLDITIIH